MLTRPPMKRSCEVFQPPVRFPCTTATNRPVCHSVYRATGAPAMHKQGGGVPPPCVHAPEDCACHSLTAWMLTSSRPGQWSYSLHTMPSLWCLATWPYCVSSATCQRTKPKCTNLCGATYRIASPHGNGPNQELRCECRIPDLLSCHSASFRCSIAYLELWIHDHS